MAEAAPSPESWSASIDPLCCRLELAAKFGQNFIFNPTGCAAHAQYLRAMAQKLDLAADMIDRLKAADRD